MATLIFYKAGQVSRWRRIMTWQGALRAAATARRPTAVGRYLASATSCALAKL
jgi:hypothetical protein